MARRPGCDQRPAPRSVSNRRHGAPAPSSPSMMAARRSRAAWLRCRAPPVDRQHPAGRLRQPRAGLDTARRRPDRPGSSYIGAQTGLRAAIDPPAYPESAARRASVARSARRRPGRSALSACRPPISARSGAIRPSTRPCAVHVAASPPAGSRSSCPAAAYADPSGTPGTPTPSPRSVPGGGREARTHICPRVRRGNFQKENQREGEPSAPPPSGLRSVPGAAGAKGHRFPCQRV